MMVSSVVHGQTCFDKIWPKLLTGTSTGGDTVINVLRYTASTYIAGGHTADSNLASISGSTTPVIFTFAYDGQMPEYSKQFVSSQLDTIADIQLRVTDTRDLLIVFDGQYPGFVRIKRWMDLVTTSVDSTTYHYSYSFSDLADTYVLQGGSYYYDNANVYVNFVQNDNQRASLVSFKTDSAWMGEDIEINWARRQLSTPQRQKTIMTVGDDMIFVGGVFQEIEAAGLGNSNGFNDFVLGFKAFERDEGTEHWLFGVKSQFAVGTWGTNYDWMTGLVYSSGYLYGMGNVKYASLGVSQYGFFVHRLELEDPMTSTPDPANYLAYNYVNQEPGSAFVLVPQLKVISTDKIQFFARKVFSNGTVQAFIYTSDFSAESISAYPLTTQQAGLKVRSGIIISEGVGIWAGGKTTISKSGGSETFSNLVGYIEDYPTSAATPCITFEGDGVEITDSLVLSSEVPMEWNVQYEEIDITTDYKIDLGGDTDMPYTYSDTSTVYDDIWCTPDISYTNPSTTFSNQNYHVKDNAIFLNFDLPTLTQTCTDIDWSYSVSGGEYSTVQTMFNDPNYQIRIYATYAYAEGGPFTISLKAWANNGQTYNYPTFQLSVTDDCVPIEIDPKPIDNLHYYSGNLAKTYDLPVPFDSDKSSLQCPINYYLYQSIPDDSEEELVVSDGVIKIDSTSGQITMYTMESSKYIYDSYSIRVRGCYLGYSCKATTINFDVRPVCSPGSFQQPSLEELYQYTWNDPALEIEIGEFLRDPNCDYKHSNYLAQMDGGALGEGISFDAVSVSFSVQTTIDPGTYIISVYGYFGEEIDTVSFPLEIIQPPQANSAPLIMGIASDQKYLYGKSQTYDLGAQFDLQEHAVETQCEIGESFISFDSDSMKIFVDETTEDNVGEYSFKCIIKETDTEEKLEKEYTIKLTIEAPPAPVENNNQNQQKESIVQNLPEVNTDVSEIIWVEPVEVDPYIPETPHIKLKRINQKGLVEFTFSKIMEVPANLTEFNDEVLKLSIIPGFDSDAQNLGFTWELYAYTKIELVIQLSFEKPLFISSQEDKDILQAELLQPDWFIDYEQVTIDKKVMNKVLPPQMDAAAAASLEATGESLEGASNAVVVGNMAMNLVLSGAMNLLWGMVNALQITVIMPLFQILIPANAQMLLGMVMSIANFEILPAGDILAEIYDFSESPPYRDNFENGGYETSNFAENLSTLFIVMMAIVVWLLFIMLLYLLQRIITKLKNFYKNRKKGLFWNFLLRFTIEAYIDISISVILNWTHMYWETWSDYFMFFVVLFFTIVAVVIPFWVPWFTWKNLDQLHYSQFEGRFGALYEGIDPENMKGLPFQTLFMFRRIIISIIVCFCTESTLTQIHVMIALTLMQIIFISLAFPYEEGYTNYLEIFNEVKVLFMGYHLLFFTDFVIDPETKFLYGWSACITVLFQVFVNLTVIVVVSIKDMVQGCKHRARVRRAKRIYKERVQRSKRAYIQQRNEARVTLSLRNNLQSIKEINEDEEGSRPSSNNQRFTPTVQHQIPAKLTRNFNMQPNVSPFFNKQGLSLTPYQKNKLQVDAELNELEDLDGNQYQRLDVPQMEDAEIPIDNQNDKANSSNVPISQNNNSLQRQKTQDSSPIPILRQASSILNPSATNIPQSNVSNVQQMKKQITNKLKGVSGLPVNQAQSIIKPVNSNFQVSKPNPKNRRGAASIQKKPTMNKAGFSFL